MNEKSIPQTLREQADAIEKLAQRIAKESQKFSDTEDRRDGGGNCGRLVCDSVQTPL